MKINWGATVNTFWTVIAGLVVIAIGIGLLNRFYRKATRERAMIRTGAGGEKVMLDGGFLALPFLHRVEEIDMRTMHVLVQRTGNASLLTEDRLRIDVEVGFYLRVEPSVQGVATAAQALGARALSPRELASLFEGRFVDAMQAVVASKTMDELHEDRSGFVSAVAQRLTDSLTQSGLKLDSVSLTGLDQASFATLDENNVFNAVGMRRLAEIIASNKTKRAEIEADAEVSVRQTELEGLKRKLDIEREQNEAQIAQTLNIEQLKARSAADTEKAQQEGQRRMDQARIERERDTKLAEIDSDRAQREGEVAALLAAQSAKIDGQIALAQKEMQESTAQAESEHARKQVVAAEEAVKAERERLSAEREKEVALIRVDQSAQVTREQVRSEVEALIERAQADASAAGKKAEAHRLEAEARAQGKAALIKAENTLSEHVLKMKVDMHKIDRLPEIAERMMKPMEKIDSIRINQVSGLGNAGGPSNASESGGPIGNAVDGVLNLAFQLPAMQKLGQSLGMNLDLGDLDGGAQVKQETPDTK
jgi:flotillin